MNVSITIAETSVFIYTRFKTTKWKSSGARLRESRKSIPIKIQKLRGKKYPCFDSAGFSRSVVTVLDPFWKLQCGWWSPTWVYFFWAFQTYILYTLEDHFSLPSLEVIISIIIVKLIFKIKCKNTRNWNTCKGLSSKPQSEYTSNVQ